MHICNVKGCKSESRKLKIKYRSFPKDINMLKKWIAATGNELLHKVEVGKFGKYKICNLHFSDQYKLRPTFQSTDVPVPTESIPVEVKDIDRIAEGINLVSSSEVIKKKDKKYVCPKFVVAKQYVQIDGENVKLIPRNKKTPVKPKSCENKKLNIKVENLRNSLLVNGTKNGEEKKASIFVNDGCKLHKNSKFIRIKASKKEALEKSGKYKIIRELKPIKKIQLQEHVDPKIKYLLNNGNDLNIADTLPDLNCKNECQSILQPKIVAIELLKLTNDLVSSKIAVNENGLSDLNSKLTKKDVIKIEQEQFEKMENVPPISTSEMIGQDDLNLQLNLNKSILTNKSPDVSLVTENLGKYDPMLDIHTVTSNEIITESSGGIKISQPENHNVNSVSNPIKFIKIKASDISKIENSGKYKILRTLASPMQVTRKKKKMHVNKMGTIVNPRFKLAKNKILKKDSCNPHTSKEKDATTKLSTYSTIGNSSEESDMKITDISSQICPSKCMNLDLLKEKDNSTNTKSVNMFKSIETQQIPASTIIHNSYRTKGVIQVDSETKMKMEIANLKARIMNMENEKKAKIKEMTGVKRKLRHMEKKVISLKNKAESFKEFESFHLLSGQVQSFIRSQLNNTHREKFGRLYTKLDKMLACSILNCSKPCYNLLSKIFIMPSVTKQLKTFIEDNVRSGQNITTINDGELIYNIS
ncbi:PREDICTED: uncharacterized protein LOC108568206 [Nicrophorus vespilloides]|uniref:Uncharacterized protein LOC108568206 n=1 Tax=Nicrophorus vespilloides TaxID=110193 RepID=A0ABM1NCU2_NICVS|nr:PREDICTED: uncharacterized protein LOC108568206 [Nicrophorus vespilloides]